MNGAPLRIGITCYPTTGGSGIIGTEVGLALARRGHQVHFVCSALPERLGAEFSAGEKTLGIFFHRVEIRDYPLPHLGPYPLALAGKLAAVTDAAQLDLLHVHYAIPHATSAFLARQLLESEGKPVPRIITTLHGTDITRVGSDPSLRAVNRFSLLRSDGLTVPSAFLQRAALERLALPAATPIEVIPNFVDTDRFQPAERRADPGSADRPRVLLHSSNFRPLKRIEDVVRIFAGVQQQLPSRLVLVGDGPERPRIEALVAELGLVDKVQFLGMQLDVVAALQQADVFLLPSSTEGFGLAALEALSCGVPVVASRVGGIPEVVDEGTTGFLCPPRDVAAMTAAVLRLLRDPALHQRMSQQARATVLKEWRQEPRVAQYEAYYRHILGRPPAT